MTNEYQNKCYECKHRRDIAGSAHSQCVHPALHKSSPLDEMQAILASVGRATPVHVGSNPLGVRGDSYGISQGWFNWPWNFDPVWLNHCDGFEAKEAAP